MVMTFNDIRNAFDWLVNVKFEELSPEQRKELRYHKKNFNHNTVSVEKMEEILTKYGSLEKNFKFELK